MKKTITIIFALLITQGVFAQDFDPEKVIKYRKDFMTAVKGHNNDIKAIVNGAVPFKGHLDMHISSLEKLFSEIESLFPEGSDFGDTNAKDAVWDNPAKFKETAQKARQALSEFKQVAAKGNMADTRAAFKNFGKSSCGGCHKSFKKKKK